MTSADQTTMPVTDIFLFFDLSLYSTARAQAGRDRDLCALPIARDPWGIDLEKTEAWQELVERLKQARDHSHPRLFITADLCGHEMAHLARVLTLLPDAELDIYWRGLLRQDRDGCAVHFAESESFPPLTSPRDFHRLSDSERRSLVLQWNRVKDKRDAQPVFLNGQLSAAGDGFLDPLIRELYEEGQLRGADADEAITRVTDAILQLRYGFNNDYVRRQVARCLRH